jgi:hypothetical protein
MNDKDHGWAPDVGTGGSEAAKEANEKAFDPPDTEPGAGREISDEEKEGVPPTDTEARTPLGVGESTRTSGEDLADDEGAEGTKGASERPYGRTDESDSPGEPVEEDSPHVQPGDQGG